MPDTSSIFTRRTLLATLVGGATVATALAQPSVRRTLTSGQAFKAAFNSPNFSLVRSGHLAWTTEIGNVLQVRGGPSMRVTRVEAFADYGRPRANLIRDRAFMVSFQLLNGGQIGDDAIYNVSHPRHGAFDLFLITDATLPGIVQAVFN